MSDASLERRFTAHLQALLPDRPPLLIALSGGVDSVVLLRLLRFSAASGYPLTAAHFDHRMRPESAADAAWVRGLCTAWGVPLRTGEATTSLKSEEAARRARYAFLRAAAAAAGATWIVTAHHADDQAETVLFRALRGTGLAGLRGMRARTGDGLLRPLLPFWREEIEEYAARAGLRWRADATNATLGPARNRIRNRILPELERHVAPGARRNLVALAEQARESEEGWAVRTARARRRLVRREGDAFLLAREPLRDYDRPITTRLLRQLLARLGPVPSRIGTHSALQFISDAPSGREMHLAGGVRIRIEFDRARIERVSQEGADDVLLLEADALAAPVERQVVLGGRAFRITARVGAHPQLEPGALWRAEIPLAKIALPLTVRGRRAGDWVRTRAGSRSLKRLMIDRRVPRGERASRPVIADASGAVVWAAGLSGDRPHETGDEPILYLTVYDA